MKDNCACNPINGGDGNCQCVNSSKVNIEKEMVNHPDHYQFGKNNEYEAIKVIDAWDLGFSLGNAIKYISRAGKKGKYNELEDLRKALWYLEHHIKKIEEKNRI